MNGLGDKQKLGLVTFVPESRLPVVQTSSILNTETRPRKPETSIRDGFIEEMEQEFPFGTFRTEKQDYLFRCSVAPGYFYAGTTKKFVFHQLFLNGKQLSPLTILCSQICMSEYR